MTLDVGERSEVPPVSARSSLPPSARPLPPSDEVSAALGHARTRRPLTSRTHSQLEPNKRPLALTNGLPFGQLHILTYQPPPPFLFHTFTKKQKPCITCQLNEQQLTTLAGQTPSKHHKRSGKAPAVMQRSSRTLQRDVDGISAGMSGEAAVYPSPAL